MQHHIEQLKAAVMNEGAFRAALEGLKATKPSRDTLLAAYHAIARMPHPRRAATKTELYRSLERVAASARRDEARAEVSRRIMPI